MGRHSSTNGHSKRQSAATSNPTSATRGISAFAIGKEFRESASRYREQRGTARRVLQLALGYRRAFAVFAFAVALGSLGGVVSPLLLRQLIDVGIEQHRARVVVELAVAMAIIALATNGLLLLQSYVAARISESLVFDMRSSLFRHLQQMSLGFYTRTQTGALVNRINTDVAGAQRALTDILTNVVGNAVTVAFSLVAMATLSWQVTVGAFLVVPIFGVASRRVGRRLAVLSALRYDQSASLVSFLTERLNVSGAVLVALFGSRARERASFEERANGLRNTGIRLVLFSRTYSVALMLGAGLAGIVIYGWGGVLAAHGTLQIGTLIALATYLATTYMPLGQLAGLSGDVTTMLVSFSRAFEVLDLEPELVEPTPPSTLAPGPTTVRYEHVGFTYPAVARVSLPSLENHAAPQRDTGPVLFDVTFTAKPGELVALVGPTGAGKSTIATLLPRLYDTTTGAVRLNDVDVREMSLASLRSKVGVVTQEVHLFHDTLRANLLYARPDASTAELLDALALAQLDDLAHDLPDGLDTIVGERGHRLSGGERQRVAIARLILKAPDVVVLDEATAHLDYQSEAKVQRALEHALAGRTALVIAHRLSTVQRADLLLVIERGAIVARGTHEELLARGGLYADLYRTQFEDLRAPHGERPTR